MLPGRSSGTALSSSRPRSSGRGGSGRRAVRAVPGRGWFESPAEGVVGGRRGRRRARRRGGQLEHQVHLGGPAADAAYGDEPGDQFLVASADVRVRTTVPSRSLAQRSRSEASCSRIDERRGVPVRVLRPPSRASVIRRLSFVAGRGLPVRPVPASLVDDGATSAPKGPSGSRGRWVIGRRGRRAGRARDRVRHLVDRGLERCARHG